MKCVIEGNGVKVFGKAVHALSRIGEDIWLDPLEKGLAVRSVNSAHSAYACFLFSPLFFQQYILNLDQLKENKAAKCKVSLKSVLPLFRNVSSIDRTVHRCEITINISDNRVIFMFKCRHGITKTHNLRYQECEALQAVFPAHLCPNVLKAHSKLLSDMILHFPISQEEITLSVIPVRVKLKNYFEEDNEHNRSMCTEMSLHPDEFDYFQVGVDSEITFCLKELRGLLTFAESHGLPVCIHFGASGKPVSFSVDDMLLEAIVVLATLVDPATENLSQVSTAEEAPAPRKLSKVCPADISLADTSVTDISVHEGPLEAEAALVASQHQAFSTSECVASSQDSPVFSPAFHLRKLMQLHERRVDLLKPVTSAGSTPATSKIRSLLFGAVVSGQEEGNPSELPSLVYASDTEDDAAEDCGRLQKRRM
ncbi:cell cycle checkpoint control protein RAD9B [Trichomycterus rosablanca]|uniref:cell cycle checkpoint control protein RAD9B n=1 Tax=Trichomycterus rosablanca TaxID=2290929 RepID=UPI002F354D9D